MYSVRIKGFPTKKEAEEFMAWFEGQGEQDAQIWFECNNAENDGRSPWTVMDKSKADAVEAGEVVEMTVRMS